MKDILLIISAVFLGSIGQVLLKMGMNKVGDIGLTSIVGKIIKIIFSPLVFSGFAVFGVSAVLWLVVLSKKDLSYAYPMVSLSYVFLFLASWLLFKENINFMRIMGMLIICLGVIFVAKS